jgi:hypothetical protein
LKVETLGVGQKIYWVDRTFVPSIMRALTPSEWVFSVQEGRIAGINTSDDGSIDYRTDNEDCEVEISQDDLHLTRKQAQAEADRRNGEGE